MNLMNLSEQDRQRIIEAEWEVPPAGKENELYDTEIIIYAYDRLGVLLEVTMVFTENRIDVKSVNSRTSKQGIATINIGFTIHSVEELEHLIKKLHQIEGIKDIQRTRS